MTDLDRWLAEVAAALPEGATVELREHGTSDEVIVEYGALRIREVMAAGSALGDPVRFGAWAARMIEREARGEGEFG